MLLNKLAAIVRDLVVEASRQPIVLLDYYINGLIDNDKTPLSHASLLCAHILKHHAEPGVGAAEPAKLNGPKVGQL